MKATELRIGNYVRTTYGHTVISLDGMMDLEPFGGFYPCFAIPLAEQWLKDFGFKYDGGYFVRGKIMIHFESKEVLFHVDDFGDYLYLGIRCEYVHQFQNLYHSLTGEELKFV